MYVYQVKVAMELISIQSILRVAEEVDEEREDLSKEGFPNLLPEDRPRGDLKIEDGALESLSLIERLAEVVPGLREARRREGCPNLLPGARCRMLLMERLADVVLGPREDRRREACPNLLPDLLSSEALSFLRLVAGLGLEGTSDIDRWLVGTGYQGPALICRLFLSPLFTFFSLSPLNLRSGLSST